MVSLISKKRKQPPKSPATPTMSTTDPHPTATTPSPAIRPFATASTTATAATTAAKTPPPQSPILPQQQSQRPLTPLPQHPQPHPYQQQALHLYASQSLPVRHSNSTITATSGNKPPHHHHAPPLPHYQEPSPQSQGILYPVASSGRGFIPKAIRAQQCSSDQAVTVANPGGYPPRPVLAYHHRPIGSPHLEPMNHPMHLIRSTNSSHLPQFHHHPHLGSSSPLGSAPIKGIPISTQTKVAPPPSSVSDGNGHRNLSRDKSKDDSLAVVRDRKVRLSDGASLYALCRSWLRNGVNEEIQPHYGDGVRSLPRPLPMHLADNNLPKKKEDEEEENEEQEDEGFVEDLSAKDLLKRHIIRAKKVRARLRGERLKRIARYKSRLALLLPPVIEQCRNDNA